MKKALGASAKPATMGRRNFFKRALPTIVKDGVVSILRKNNVSEPNEYNEYIDGLTKAEVGKALKEVHPEDMTKLDKGIGTARIIQVVILRVIAHIQKTRRTQLQL